MVHRLSCRYKLHISEFSCSSKLQDEKIKHGSNDTFLPVVATMEEYVEYEEIEYRDFNNDGHYTKYGVVTTDNFAYISIVSLKTTMLPNQGNKSVVDQMETIPFPRRTSKKETYE